MYYLIFVCGMYMEYLEYILLNILYLFDVILNNGIYYKLCKKYIIFEVDI